MQRLAARMTRVVVSVDHAGNQQQLRRQRIVVVHFGRCADFARGFLGWRPLDDALDLAVGVLLVKLLGFHWVLLPAAGAELIPGVDLAPTWTAAVLIITGPGKKLRWILLAAALLIAAGVAIYLWRR